MKQFKQILVGLVAYLKLTRLSQKSCNILIQFNQWKCYILIIITTQRRRKTSKDFLKCVTSHFIVRVWKRLLKVLWWEGVEDQTELQYIDPHSYGRQRCVLLVLQGSSTGGPGAQLSAGWWLSLLHLITNWSGPKTPSGFPRAPSAGCGFPYHISSITRLISNCLTFVLTKLYNSSTPTQSPTQSLRHVWSSSSGNNCHAVHRSLSSCASLWSGTFTLSHIISRAHLRDFLS